MRPLRTLNKRARRVRHRAEALRQLDKALTYVKSPRFVVHDDDIQRYLVEYLLLRFARKFPSRLTCIRTMLPHYQ
jgi:hypothetical protein